MESDLSKKASNQLFLQDFKSYEELRWRVLLEEIQLYGVF